MYEIFQQIIFKLLTLTGPMQVGNSCCFLRVTMYISQNVKFGHLHLYLLLIDVTLAASDYLNLNSLI